MHAETSEEHTDPHSEFVEIVAEVFRLLADATRIRVILALKSGELSVNELAEIVDRPAPAVSQHLAKLRWSKLVRVRQEATRMYYSLTDDHALRLITEAILQAEHTVEDAPRHHA
ncbi:metalloregulator ArsR/SmtB family transcription factor [Microbacterium sp. SY138]|uniref:ArsR/SmtB family transcription factor n=1 Tax=unclassified Microbacterium TaxID=2609290 RepID=UPI00321B446A